MPEGRRYRHPPVVEALCEVFFAGSTWTDDLPARFHERIKDRFPLKQLQKIQEAEIHLSQTGETAASVRERPYRHQFLTESKDCMVQLEQDLVVVNRLPPYAHFEQWEPTIYSAVDVYNDLAKVQGIVRVGVRYINKVRIPARPVELSKYFNIYPTLPAGLREQLGPFMLRMMAPTAKADHRVIVTYGSAPSDKEGESAFLLDLYDLYEPQVNVPIESLKEHVTMAHAVIEQTFEGSILDSLRALFDRESPS